MDRHQVCPDSLLCWPSGVYSLPVRILGCLLAYSLLQAINIANPAAEGFVLRWPFCRGRFNTGASYYQHRFELLADIEDILTVTLQEQLSISPSSFHVR